MAPHSPDMAMMVKIPWLPSATFPISRWDMVGKIADSPVEFTVISFSCMVTRPPSSCTFVTCAAFPML